MSSTRGTLVDVARVCAVSQSTVSRVLNSKRYGRFSVSDEVRERIVRVARELNYRPSVAARNMSVGSTNLIAVLGIRSIDSERAGPVERAVEAAAESLDEHGYEICMQMYSRRHSPFDLPGLRVDGILTVGANQLEDIEMLDRSGVPYVSINGVVGAKGTLVAPDDRGGTFAALEHLMTLGHRRIAYFDHPAVDASHPSVFERRAAFREAQTKLVFSIPDVAIAPLPSGESWKPYFEPFLREMVILGKATAVLTYSHHAALSLLRKAHDIGLRVPNDFSLLCFNDEPVVSLSVPSITAVAWPSHEIGRLAADILIKKISGKKVQPPAYKLPEVLVVRESTGKPPTGNRLP